MLVEVELGQVKLGVLIRRQRKANEVVLTVRFRVTVLESGDDVGVSVCGKLPARRRPIELEQRRRNLLPRPDLFSSSVHPSFGLQAKSTSASPTFFTPQSQEAAAAMAVAVVGTGISDDDVQPNSPFLTRSLPPSQSSAEFSTSILQLVPGIPYDRFLRTGTRRHPNIQDLSSNVVFAGRETSSGVNDRWLVVDDDGGHMVRMSTGHVQDEARR
ncbi:hypothetical protein GALMADRAFT_1141010 [Galerina marginata CBS 339.88]|uniref:Uncharacterized protein n=1 Tax=Galerina marginata (strain CBS 339.88) TaxID=685588 RepID=A0A067SA39_GALM3|nr:hypothetical protein GALMADRAFT_1141010 [Galerina marginata CBS 339.88]